MPNWCYTQICFKGKSENINRLREHIEATNEWGNRNPTWCNIRYFLSLSNFDLESYVQRFSNPYDYNFRGSIYDPHTEPEQQCDNYSLYYTSLETAWWIDYQLLQIISMIYDVKFSAYSEEPNMDVFSTCKNGDIDDYNFDTVIIPDYDQLDEATEKERTFVEIEYINPVKEGDEYANSIINQLDERGIEYETLSIDKIQVPNIYGVYYHYMNGITYDDDTYKKFHRYPELDPFNKYKIGEN